MTPFKKINKLLLVKNMYKHLAFSGIQELNELSDSIYSSLKKELDAYANYLKKRIADMPEKWHEEFLESQGEDYWKYAEGFPHIVGYLLLVRYYSLLEYVLLSVANHVEKELAQKLDAFMNKHRKGSLIKRYVDYLKDAAGFTIDIRNSSW